MTKKKSQPKHKKPVPWVSMTVEKAKEIASRVEKDQEALFLVLYWDEDEQTLKPDLYIYQNVGNEEESGWWCLGGEFQWGDEGPTADDGPEWLNPEEVWQDVQVVFAPDEHLGEFLEEENEPEPPSEGKPQVGVYVHVIIYDEKTDATLEDRDATPEEAVEFCYSLDDWVGRHGDSYGDMAGEVSNDIIKPKKGSYAAMDFRFVKPEDKKKFVKKHGKK